MTDFISAYGSIIKMESAGSTNMNYIEIGSVRLLGNVVISI